MHQQFKTLYSKSYEKDVEFLSTHFCDLDSLLKENILLFDFDTISAILSSNQLKLRDEDQLLDFVNILYSQDHRYSILYESVDFSNVGSEKITKFINTFEMNDLTNSIWHRICDRLKHSVSKTSDKSEPQGITFNKSEPFSGIINYLRQQSHDHIEQEINLTSSTSFTSEYSYQLQNITKFEDPNNGFASDAHTSENWICIEFKNHQIIPTYYTIKSIGSYFTHYHFLKSWAIETSNDNNSWNIIDEVQNNTDLKGNLLTHTFPIKKPPNQPIRYLRLRLTGPDWVGSNYLSMNSFELFGTLI